MTIRTDPNSTDAAGTALSALATLMPIVDQKLRFSTVIGKVAALCATRHPRWLSESVMPEPLSLADSAELAAAIVEINACLSYGGDDEGAQMWRSYLFTAKAMAAYNLSDAGVALQSLVAARECIDAYPGWTNRNQTYLYVWLLGRMVDLSETAEDWATAESLLDELLERGRTHGLWVADALCGNIERGMVSHWSLGNMVEEAGNPLHEIWARLANASFQRSHYAKAARFLVVLQQAGVQLSQTQREQLCVAAERTVSQTVVRAAVPASAEPAPPISSSGGATYDGSSRHSPIDWSRSGRPADGGRQSQQSTSRCTCTETTRCSYCYRSQNEQGRGVPWFEKGPFD